MRALERVLDLRAFWIVPHFSHRGCNRWRGCCAGGLALGCTERWFVRVREPEIRGEDACRARYEQRSLDPILELPRVAGPLIVEKRELGGCVELDGAVLRVHEAHALGLIHRDIKPANIVLTERPDESDVVKVVDFGLVKNFGGSLVESAASDAITGTPLYMAPESIAQPDTIDGRSDLYAVGAVAYFLLTGQHVFEAATVFEVCSKHMLEAPVPPSERLGTALPADLEAIVLGCLAKDRNHRPAAAAVLRASLLACADAGGNDQLAAREWWRAHRASHTSVPRAVDSSSRPVTMAIDLGARSTLAVS